MTIKDKALKALENSKIVFDETKHEYQVDGKKLPSVTNLLKEAGIAPNYSAVDEEVLKQARLRGEAIHFQVEDAIRNNDYNEVGDEAKQIIDYLSRVFYNSKKKEFVDLLTEGMLYSDNPIKPYCGRFDLLGKVDDGYVLFDIKTMKSWNSQLENYSRWQLSLYARALLEKGINVKYLTVLRFDTVKSGEIEKHILEPRNLEKIDDTRLDKMLRTGSIDRDIIPLSNDVLSLFHKIKDSETELKALEEQVKDVKKALYEYMKENDILSATTEDGTIKITRTKESVVESVDKKRLEIEKPDIYQEYKTTSKREGYVKITIK